MQPTDDLTTILHTLALQGPVVSILCGLIYLLVRVIKQQYADQRNDRADLLAAYKQVGEAMNALAKQQEISNALQKSDTCRFQR